MKVLSLFDGISCGMEALKRAGIKVDKYYASEIDKFAETVSKYHYPNIVRLGDINDWKNWDIKENIDILFAGFPCQSFSLAGKQLNFNDPRGQLFFKALEVLKHYKPKYFLFENVRMKKEYQDRISELLGVEPILINSSLVSAQNRQRLYWTNITEIKHPKNKCIVLNNIKSNKKNIDNNLIIPIKYKPTFNKKTSINKNKPIRLGGYCEQGQGQRIYCMSGKSVCLSALGGGWGAKTGLYLDDSNIVRKPTKEELCRLQTLPDNYFDDLNLSYNQIAKAIGNGWTIDVITHILSHMKEV
jgi:DNA (cytosine-5)-methyltransferase 3A